MLGNVNTYRVVGVRADGSQHVLSARLSLEDANYVKQRLLAVEIFKKVIIQPDEPEEAAAGPPSAF